MDSLIIIFFFKIILISKINSSLIFEFPISVTLSNENILVVEKNGIHICDSSFTKIIETKFYFTKEEDKIKNESDLSKVILERKSTNIFALINFKVFIFDSDGTLLYNSSEKLIKDETVEYCTLVPIINQNDIYYYIIGYFNSTNNLNLELYAYDFYHQVHYNICQYKDEVYKIERYNNGFYYRSYYYKSKSLSCEYLKADTDRVLVCFFVVLSESKQYLIEGFYEVNIYSNYIKRNYNYEPDYDNIENIKFIKTENNYNNRITLVCFHKSDNKVSCYRFEIIGEEGIFYDGINFLKSCREKIYGMTLKYLFEKREVVFSCSDIDGSIQSLFFDEYLECATTSYKQFLSCDSIYGYSVLYSESKEDYYVLSDVKCNNISKPFVPLINIENQENYELIEDEDKEDELAVEIELEEEESKEKEKEKKELEDEKELKKEEQELKEEKEKELEEESKKSIEELDYIKEEELINEEEESQMKIREESEEIEKEDESEEKEEFQRYEKLEEKILEYSEEKEEIINENEFYEENFIEEDTKENEEIILSFECKELRKCSKCNNESISKDLCIECNNNQGYYYLKKSYFLESLKILNDNKYIDCVNNLTKPTNYYFNEENKYYEACYDSCATCNYKGDGNENNCTSCEENFVFKPDVENSTDCVSKCYYYYYYTEYNQYKCTALPECPDDYDISVLIIVYMIILININIVDYAICLVLIILKIIMIIFVKI